MATDGSVTRWFRQLSEGDEHAINELWDHFFVRLTELARKRLTAYARTFADEEDIALSTLKSLWKGAQRGHFGTVADRNELWRLLSTIARRKVIDQIDYEQCQKRDVGRQVRHDVSAEIIERLSSNGPTPDQVVEFEDQVKQLIQRLPNEEYVAIAKLRLEGATIPEIAEQLSRGHATIERKLKVIRALWEE